MRRFILLALCHGLACSVLLAKDPGQLFKAAEKSMAQNKYEDAIATLAEVEQTLGRPTPKVESVRVYAYVGLRDWVHAKVALENYKRLAGSSSSQAHEALLKLQTQIDQGLVELEAKAKEAKAKAKEKALASAQAAVKAEEKERAARTESLRATRQTSLEQLESDPARIMETFGQGAALSGQRLAVVTTAIKEKTGPFAGRLVQAGEGFLAVLASGEDASITSEFSDSLPQQRIEQLLRPVADKPAAVILDANFAGGRWRLAWAAVDGTTEAPAFRQSLEFYPGRDLPVDQLKATLKTGAWVQRLIWDEPGQRWCTLLLTDTQLDVQPVALNEPGEHSQFLLQGERVPQLKMKELQQQGYIFQDARWNGREWTVLMTNPGEKLRRTIQPLYSRPFWFVADGRSDLMNYLADSHSPVPVAAAYGHDQWLLALTDDQNLGAKGLPPYLTVDNPASVLLTAFRDAGNPLNLLVELPSAQP